MQYSLICIDVGSFHVLCALLVGPLLLTSGDAPSSAPSAVGSVTPNRGTCCDRTSVASPGLRQFMCFLWRDSHFLEIKSTFEILMKLLTQSPGSATCFKPQHCRQFQGLCGSPPVHLRYRTEGLLCAHLWGRKGAGSLTNLPECVKDGRERIYSKLVPAVASGGRNWALQWEKELLQTLILHSHDFQCSFSVDLSCTQVSCSSLEPLLEIPGHEEAGTSPSGPSCY